MRVRVRLRIQDSVKSIGTVQTVNFMPVRAMTPLGGNGLRQTWVTNHTCIIITRIREKVKPVCLGEKHCQWERNTAITHRHRCQTWKVYHSWPPEMQSQIMLFDQVLGEAIRKGASEIAVDVLNRMCRRQGPHKTVANPETVSGTICTSSCSFAVQVLLYFVCCMRSGCLKLHS